ncbi:Vancomycin resistance protein YoaR, contains peptidoglycan-binding and VanW domains [Streptomyces sp. cf386]|uniref:VanW family protein n=1 Tax=Streptomyces sp. cf386 TaxID=1761904 RepID=UPI00087FBDD0|nr:VanW family protein [Streptomyces sp. cf386]SDO91894.1 Vancomycin resistance protein YoaR, contains peptidoglycan-binding and VanW domains [Streptomyces sp. cf386]
MRLRVPSALRNPSKPRIASVPPLALAGGALAVGVGGLYVAGLLVAGGDIDAGTTVRGVDIGGLSRAEAVRKLEDRLDPAASRELTVTVGDRKGTVDPRQVGITFDYEKTVDRASRSDSADPFTVIGGIFSSGDAVEPVVRVDENKAHRGLDKLAKSLDQKVREGAVTFTDGQARPVTPHGGYALDTDAAVTPLRSAFLSGEADSVTALPARETKPKVTAAEVRRAVREFAQPAMSAPVMLTAAGERFTIGPAVLGEYLTMRPDKAGKLTPHLDAKGLRAAPAVTEPLADLPARPQNATLSLDSGQVVAADDAKAGVLVTDKALGKAVLPLLTKSGSARTGEIAARVTQPQVTAENARQLGLTEEMSSFTVNFEPAPYRTKNIGRAVELINGSVVMPGNTWSFNKTVGERTEANGFTEGIMILNNEFTKAPGGGVSAVATTMFNAMFFAGVKPVEHGAHSFYIERYPEGREATVAWGSLDLKFDNDSGNAIYIQAESTDTSVTITFLGTKKYDEIESVTGPRTKVKQPEKKVSTDEKCVPQTPLEGFDVTVERVFLADGKEVKREPFRTHYTPRDEIVCE